MATKKKIIIGLLSFIIVLLLVGIVRDQRHTDRTPVSFGECVARGYQVTEDEPRQCILPDGTLFTEEAHDLDPQEWNGQTPLTPATRTEYQARMIAQSATACTDIGSVGLLEQYNPISATWWFTLDTREDGLLCDPACVVHDTSGEVQINWRCRGLLPPPAEEEDLIEEEPEWLQDNEIDDHDDGSEEAAEVPTTS